MPFSVTERFDSRRVILSKDRESGTMEFTGYGSDDDQVARDGFRDAIPTVFTFFANPLALLDFEIYTLGGLFWRATANFGPNTAPFYPAVGIPGAPTPVADAPGINEPLGADYGFDFMGTSEHITQSKRTISKTNNGGGAAADANGTIGATNDNVIGCERISPNQEWSRTVTFESVTMSYIETISNMVGSTNNAPFHGKPAGSQIFLGGNCQIDDTYRAKVTFNFLSRPNLTNIVICEDLIVPFKRGSDYLWVMYGPKTDANTSTRQPTAVYVERIVDAVDFGQLRIGV